MWLALADAAALLYLVFDALRVAGRGLRESAVFT